MTRRDQKWRQGRVRRAAWAGVCAVLALWHVLTLKPEQALPPGMTAEYAAMMGKGAEKSDGLPPPAKVRCRR